MKDFGKFLFKHRDKTGIPFFLILIFFSKPEIKTFFISLPFVISGELLRIFSLMYTGEATRAKEIKAPFLATGGPYARVRNPIYIGNFLIAFGILIFYNPPFIFYPLFLFLFFIQYYLIVLEEEKFLEREFGDEYIEYRKNTGRFFPKLKPYGKRTDKIYSFFEVFKFEKSTLLLISALFILGSVLIFIR